jgi:type I restriction enzyme S subunit
LKGLPIGWEPDRVDSIGTVVTGKTPSTARPQYYGEDYQFVKTPDMHGNVLLLNTDERLSQEGLDSQPSQTIPEGSICVSCIGTAGIVSITTSKCQTNQQINSIVLKDKSELEWAFFTLRGLKATIELFGSTGTTMTNLSKGKFAALKILRPHKDLILRFHHRANPMFENMRNLLEQTMALTRSRDLLLPRLISGKLSAENLNIQFPPGMAEELNEAEAATHA